MSKIAITSRSLSDQTGVEYALCSNFIKFLVAMKLAKKIGIEKKEKGKGSDVYEIPANVVVDLTKIVPFDTANMV